MGWHYKKYSKSIELAELEIIAKNEKRGLWIDKNPISPSEWRTNK
jgi:endonuclease YncB( thermonuclease family)